MRTKAVLSPSWHCEPSAADAQSPRALVELGRQWQVAEAGGRASGRSIGRHETETCVNQRHRRQHGAAHQLQAPAPAAAAATATESAAAVSSSRVSCA